MPWQGVFRTRRSLYECNAVPALCHVSHAVQSTASTNGVAHERRNGWRHGTAGKMSRTGCYLMSRHRIAQRSLRGFMSGCRTAFEPCLRERYSTFTCSDEWCLLLCRYCRYWYKLYYSWSRGFVLSQGFMDRPRPNLPFLRHDIAPQQLNQTAYDTTTSMVQHTETVITASDASTPSLPMHPQ